MKRTIVLAATHLASLAAGLALSVYFLPILTARDSPTLEVLQAEAAQASYSAELSRELRGSDGLHWGEGTISVSDDKIVH